MKRSSKSIKYLYSFCAITLITAMLICATTVYAYSGNGDIIVHITETGSCYHRESCGSLRSDIPIPLEEAYVKGYWQCEKCRPPIYTGEAERKTLLEKSTGESSTYESYSNRTGNYTRYSDYSRNVNLSQRQTASNIHYLILVFLGSLGIMIIWVIIKKIRSSKEQKKEIIRKQQEYDSRKQYYEANYKGKSIQEIVGAPKDIIIQNDGTVIKGVVTREKPYGDLTVCVSSSGKRYHKDYICRGNIVLLRVNIYQAISKGYTACSFCFDHDEPIPDWYKEIPKVVKAKKEFESVTAEDK